MNALTLPDIARQTTTADLPLDWVGMQGIALPVQIGGQRVAAEADAGVSLDDPQARGIHMSRLYLALAELEQGELDLSRLRAVLQRFLDSHAGLSRRAYLRLRLAPLLRRPALVSPLSGWKRYPLVLDTRLEGDDFQAEVHLELDLLLDLPLFGGTGPAIDPGALRPGLRRTAARSCQRARLARQ